ncbi:MULTISPECIES: DUF3618 domain-containing protein [Sphingosinicellaceae]|uniref:DUF3618 domain-containing protein n=1 Tax=Sphingosinicellaceae TaxID=2820280 RepID=UPI001C1E8B69|nr:MULTISPECIES: DUF3618 domain-containing protein [Polymorphobacter]QYE34238.1 DUF3618 domain-containing protein [Polymorphobacter sp. PAMC 29334]UAJ09417.1 DUF3618 domain-containing protein [Polymorphobacter megasporae]
MSDTATLEREAESTRERIASTIDDLQARLSPRALVDNAVDSLNASSSRAFESVKGAAMAHPIAIAGAGLAAGIALLARSKVKRATIEYGDSYAAYADYDDGYAANLAADDIPAGPARQRIEAIQHKAHVAVDDNPLTVVLVGVATGALIGAIMPVSDIEYAAFGDIGARLEAAGDAAIASAKVELDLSKLSFAGGTAGIMDRAVQSLLSIVGAAGGALLRKPTSSA